MVRHVCSCGYETRFKANLRRHQNSTRCDRLAAKPLEVMQARLEAQERQIRDMQEALTKRSHDEGSDSLLREKDDQIQRLNDHLTKALDKGGRSKTINITNNVVVNVFGKESLSHIDGAAVLDLVRHPPSSVPKFIQLVYSEPTNKTVRTPNIRDPYYLVSSGDGEFRNESKADVHRELYRTNKERMLNVAQATVEEMEVRAASELEEERAMEAKRAADESMRQEAAAAAKREAEEQAEARAEKEVPMGWSMTCPRHIRVRKRKQEILQKMNFANVSPPAPLDTASDKSEISREIKRRKDDINKCKRFHNKVEEGRQMDLENRKGADDNERDSLKIWHEQSKGEIEKVLLSILRPNRGSAAV